MKKHIKGVHEGQKNHKCESCNISFFQAGELKRHIKSIGHKNKTNISIDIYKERSITLCKIVWSVWKVENHITTNVFPFSYFIFSNQIFVWNRIGKKIVIVFFTEKNSWGLIEKVHRGIKHKSCQKDLPRTARM